MSQRRSGYLRIENDSYSTPTWVTDALVPHLPATSRAIWEPAAGNGQMVAALTAAGFDVIATDISTGYDFLTQPAPKSFCGITTNPPYMAAEAFIERALGLMPSDGYVAMLLRTDFDHARRRCRLFADCPWFAKKLVLTRRIRWFAGSTGSPSFNHAWYLWVHAYRGLPTLVYGPSTPDTADTTDKISC